VGATFAELRPFARRASLGLALGDFNGDGNGSRHHTSVNTRIQSGSVTARSILIAADTGPVAQGGGVAAGDFNGDGKADLANVGFGQASVGLGNGDGSFTTKAWWWPEATICEELLRPISMATVNLTWRSPMLAMAQLFAPRQR
jgi:hypothetical protein